MQKTSHNWQSVQKLGLGRLKFANFTLNSIAISIQLVMHPKTAPNVEIEESVLKLLFLGDIVAFTLEP